MKTSRWATFSDSDSDDEKRVVRSGADKAKEELEENIKKLRNNLKIKDWNAIQTGFAALNVLVAKSKAKGETVPPAYIRLLIALEDLVAETLKDKAGLKKLSKQSNRSFNQMKLQLKKHNKDYEAQIEEFRKEPEIETAASSSSESSSSSSESSDDSDESDDDKSDASDDKSDDDSDDESESDDDKPEVKKPVPKVTKPVKDVSVHLLLPLHLVVVFFCFLNPFKNPASLQKTLQ